MTVKKQLVARDKKVLFFVMIYTKIIVFCDSASVRTVDSNVYIVTPEPTSDSKGRAFQHFLPTPIPDTRDETKSVMKKYYDFSPVYPTAIPDIEDDIKDFMASDKLKEKKKPEYIPFYPTPLPDEDAYPTSQNKNRYKTEDSPDIIMAEFKSGNKETNGMKSVKEMLSKEKIAIYSTTKKLVKENTTKETMNPMKVEDVWDIIKHNQRFETTATREIYSETSTVATNPKNKYTNKVANDLKSSDVLISPSIDTALPVDSGFHAMTINSINNHEKNNNVDTGSVEILISPSLDSELHLYESATAKSIDELKNNIKDPKITDVLLSPGVNSLTNQRYSGASDVEIFSSISKDTNEWANLPNVNSEQNRLDNAQNTSYGHVQIDEPRTIRGNENSWSFPNSRGSYKQNNYGYQNYDSGYSSQYYPSVGIAQDRFNPAQPYLPPKPDTSMSPPKAKQPMPLPPVAMPPPPPPPKPQDTMGPPSLTYDSIPSYPSQDDSKPPDSDDFSYSSFSDSGPPSADSYKYSPPSDSDSYPQLIFDDHHHHFHDDDDFHHHHHHHHPHTTTTTTTTTTPAPQKRENNRFSYYYLGKKLWYLPLYFSVYFIIYVGALIIKSIARHKITYPQHYKTKRAIDGLLSDETINNLTRITSNAIVKMTEKYMQRKS